MRKKSGTAIDENRAGATTQHTRTFIDIFIYIYLYMYLICINTASISCSETIITQRKNYCITHRETERYKDRERVNFAQRQRQPEYTQQSQNNRPGKNDNI